MASNCNEDKTLIENVDSNVEIVPFLGNVGETMSSSEHSECELQPKKKRKLQIRRKREENGDDSDSSSSGLEVLQIKLPVKCAQNIIEDAPVCQNQLGDKNVQDIMFNEEMTLINEEQKFVRIKWTYTY